jgi:hypothetical protein
MRCNVIAADGRTFGIAKDSLLQIAQLISFIVNVQA